MNSYEKHRDLFDGDPNIEYHQGYREELTVSSWLQGSTIPLLFCLLPIIYHILQVLDYNLLPLPELLWNFMVYITPSRLLDTIELYTNPLRILNPDLKHIPRTHAAKSESMRRILRLDTPGGIIGSVTQASRRRLSTLPGMNMGPVGTDGRPAGLGNWDNSCYQNSVLQGLASLGPLSGYLTNPMLEKPEVEGTDKPEMKMAEALKGLIATLNDSENNGKRIWTPATLKNMSSWQQQDAQEYFSKVLDEIDKEIWKVAKFMKYSQGFETDSEGTKSKQHTFSATYRSPLEGLIAQRVGCTKCGYSEGLSIIPFNCLTVPLGRSFGCDISQCLDEYTKLEQIEGVQCGKCTLLKSQRLLTLLLERTKEANINSPLRIESKARLEAVTLALEEDDYEDKTLLQKCKISTTTRVLSTKSRQAVVARPPKSLVVHFNRSVFDEMTGELRKNHAEVHFPKILDLGPWCLGSSGPKVASPMEEWELDPEQPMIASSQRQSRILGPMYELRAVVTHYGRHENGHYICYRKHPVVVNSEDEAKQDQEQEQWWRLSDDDVMKVSEENVLGQGGVFMLFYDLVEPAVSFSAGNFLIAESSLLPSYTELIDENVLKSTSPKETILLSPQATEEAHLAATIPLPDLDDSEISSDERPAATTATSISEYDEEEQDNPPYEKTKPIVITNYIPKTRGNKEKMDGDTGLEASQGSLVMV